jgi:hypothetical protein
MKVKGWVVVRESDKKIEKILFIKPEITKDSMGKWISFKISDNETESYILKSFKVKPCTITIHEVKK